jgi:hypothetical protein
MSEGQMRDLLPQLLPEKFDNPMLGILGAHLLLLRSNPDLGLLDEVVRNLRILLPGHPDVEALALRLPAAQLTAATAFEFASPPMLFKSWSLVVASSVARAEIVPTGSLAARAAELLWGSGAWLVWRKPKDAVPKRAPTAASRDRRALEVVLGHVTDFVRESASHQSLRQLSQQWALSPVEVNVLGVLSRSLQQSQIMRTFALPEGTETITKVASGDTGEIVRALGVPTATLHATLESLARKLSV